MYQNIFVTSRNEDDGEPQVYLWDDTLGLVVSPYSDFDYAYKPDPKGIFKSIRGETLKKVTRYRWDDPELYESDLPRETRVLTDLYQDDDMPSTGHIVLNIDIENKIEAGYENPMVAGQEITAIANHNMTADEYTVFLVDPTGAIQTNTIGNKTVISCKCESDLLTLWLDYYNKTAPTILTGWNIDSYDIPYLYNRLKRVFNKETANCMSPVGMVKYSQRRMRYQLAGVSCLDYLVLYKKFTYNQQPSYRLDAIGRFEVGMGKVQYEGTLDTLYKTDIKKFVDYNLNDVEIVSAIDKKMQLIELARFICHLGHVPYEDFGYSSKFIEGTIVTYLHRKGLVVPNKPRGGQEKFDAQQTAGAEGFTGAFVKAPYPGLYEWVYSLDLQSLYPSIIMGLNISPDTKMGRVINWNVDDHMAQKIEAYEIQVGNARTIVLNREEALDFLSKNRYTISSNGILYSNEKVGVIPEILDLWFNQRVEFKDTMKKYVKEGNKELADFYDRRQHVQKILLNSIYGVLGLPIFRFYDLDNALAVTATGQDVIKSTAKFLNNQYNKWGAQPKSAGWVNSYWEILKGEAKKHKESTPEKPSESDHCVYIDTDSVYFSAVPVFEKFAVTDASWEKQKETTIEIARFMEGQVNKFYDIMAKVLFNCDTHRFVIKGESVMDTGLWVAKKRYAMAKKYDLETNRDMDKMVPKGLDVVRSSFPPAFAKFMEEVLIAILKKKDKEHLDKMILDFHEAIKGMPYVSIARNTSVKKVSEYDDLSETNLTKFPLGAAAHSKAAVTYNRILRRLKVDPKYMPIMDGEKIKWVYLKKNPYGIDTVAFKGYEDPPQILELVEKYIDHNLLFEKELSNKLEDFYSALNWGRLPTQINQVAFQFFNF